VLRCRQIDVFLCCVCTVGFYSHAGQSECSPCIPGTFQSAAGQASCQPCSHGLICRSDIIVVFIVGLLTISKNFNSYFTKIND